MMMILPAVDDGDDVKWWCRPTAAFAAGATPAMASVVARVIFTRFLIIPVLVHGDSDLVRVLFQTRLGSIWMCGSTQSDTLVKPESTQSNPSQLGSAQSRKSQPTSV
ncbi:hypothetical protein Hdeb2414_s0009g00311591 [Helianthus debilis subsp. tardiflorus]